jgi:hypothetical protein
MVAAVYLIGFYFYAVFFLLNQSYLPAPFFQNPQDSFMDFYNINFAASKETFYTTFASFYSPLNALIAQAFVNSNCIHESSAFAYRACDPYSVFVFLSLAWLFVAALVWAGLRTSTDRFLWWFVLSFSFPMAFALERANYIFLAMPILFFWLAQPAKNNLMYELLLTNVKYYFLIYQGYYFFRNQFFRIFAFVLILIVATLILGLLTGLPGVGNIPKNIFGFASGPMGLDVLFNTSMNFIGGIQQFFLLDSMSKNLSRIMIFVMKISILIRLWIYWRETQPSANHHFFNFVLLIALLLLSSAPGFYSVILLIPYFIYLSQRGMLDRTTQILFILLCLPYPYVLYSTDAILKFFLWDGSSLGMPLELFMQTLIQPLLLLLLFFKLTVYSEPRV